MGETMPLRRHRATSPLPAMTNRVDIQGLRALAVLLVVLGHAGLLGATGGYVGVDVFFVVSGFLITSILLHEATEQGSLSLARFYAKRARRILPAATLTLIGTAVAATVIVPYVRAEAILKDVGWAAVFGANIHFGNARTDYFAAHQPPSPVQHYWSLAVEEQFYLVWPALIVVMLLLGARRSPATVRRRLPWLAFVVAVLSALSLTWSVTTTQSDPAAAYFSTTARCWELGAGALLAFAGRSLPRLSKRVRNVLAIAGLGMVLMAGFTFTEATPVPGYHLAVPVLGTVALLAAGSGSTTATSPAIVRLLGRQPLRWIGDVSYGFYLWHWPLLIIGMAYVGHRLDLTTKLALIGGALLLAWISYELLENPIRRARSLSLRPKPALLLWPAAIGSLALVTICSHSYIGYQRDRVAAAAAEVDLSMLPPSQRAPRTGDPVHDAIADSVDRATLDAPQAPVDDLSEAIGPWLDDPSCGASETEVTHDICPMGDVGSPRRMVVLGDSHLLMWIPALEVIAERTGYELVPITKLGCTPYDVVAWKFDRDDVFAECNAWRPWALDQVRQARPDVIVVGSASVIKSADEATGDLLRTDEARNVWKVGARSLAKDLAEIAPEVRFVQDVNRLPWNPADCLSDLDHTAADCTVEPSAWVTDSNRLVRRGIAHTGARQVRLRGLFCVHGRCPTVVDGMAVYGDDDHLAPDYVRYLAGDLEKRLRLPD
jgi:peptidoglycan/LPS O-acetylase OafA/YrhL